MPLRIALIIGGLLLTTQVVLLVLQLGTLKASHERIRAQDAKITALFRGAEPVLDQAEPLARDARRAIGPLKRSGDEIATATDVLPGLALTARELVVEAVPVLERLPRLVELSEALVPELRGLVPEIRTLLADSLSVQRETLDRAGQGLREQQRALRVLRRSLAVQEQSLRHIQSLDRKTGGELPG